MVFRFPVPSCNYSKLQVLWSILHDSLQKMSNWSADKHTNPYFCKYFHNISKLVFYSIVAQATNLNSDFTMAPMFVFVKIFTVVSQCRAWALRQEKEKGKSAMGRRSRSQLHGKAAVGQKIQRWRLQVGHQRDWEEIPEWWIVKWKEWENGIAWE